MLEQHGEVGEREHLLPFGAGGVIEGLRGTYEAHVRAGIIVQIKPTNW